MQADEQCILRKQITFISIDNGYIIGSDANGEKIVVAIPTTLCYKELPQLLHEGFKLNILSATTEQEGILHPRDIIFEPDYLIDISALARCVQPYGSPAIGYIINLFEKSTDSAARLLGEAANMFLDDCVNERRDHPASYSESIKKFFREYPLQLSACKEIDHKFFAQSRMQFDNIQTKVGNVGIEPEKGYRQDKTILEPSFFCEPLGLQGRIDLLQSDCSHLIELKSGKADDFRGRAKDEHKIQMTLYKEMLCYSLLKPRNTIQAHLFYSRYPRFYTQESSATEISRALMLRNKIVSLLIKMGYDGLRNELLTLTADDLNERGENNRLWNEYQRPHIEEILTPIRNASPLLLDYFFGQTAFVAGEMHLAKVGNGNYESGRSFADIWNAPLEAKKSNGNILTELKIEFLTDNEGISDITFSIPRYSDDFYPNFRAGDTVFIYRSNNPSETAINRQVTRGTLTSITPDRLTIHLRHKQRNGNLYPLDNYYAMEHDHLDSTFRSSFRDIYSLLTAPKNRIELLLSQRAPRIDKSRTLANKYTDNHISRIVLQAKQAEELFMLVGPPGTGKTSQALKSMVQEFMTEANCNILLASYTNRAVDEICEALERLSPQPQYIRIGSEQSCAERHRCHLLKNVIAGCMNREQIRSTMLHTRIIVGTVASLTGRKELFALKHFDVAIIDEATQILESQLAGLIAATTPDGETAIDKFILIGDPKQLPAVVAQPADKTTCHSELLNSIGINDYGTSLFERLYKWFHKHPAEGVVETLYRQGRMHPEINRFSNKHFYGNILTTIPLPHQEEELLYPVYDKENYIQKLLATKRTSFINIEETSDNPKINGKEAKAIASFVEAYYKLHTSNGIPCNPSTEIGIIVPFRSQIAMVTKAIAEKNVPQSSDIIIDTVERFQGSQREIILFGTTIGKADSIEILSSPIIDADGSQIDRKLNVALTRARKQMFIFGNKKILSLSPIYDALIKEL